MRDAPLEQAKMDENGRHGVNSAAPSGLARVGGDTCSTGLRAVARRLSPSARASLESSSSSSLASHSLGDGWSSSIRSAALRAKRRTASATAQCNARICLALRPGAGRIPALRRRAVAGWSAVRGLCNARVRNLRTNPLELSLIPLLRAAPGGRLRVLRG
jgi:hypothetical protein